MKFLVEPRACRRPRAANRRSRFNFSAGGKELWSRQAELPGDGAAALPVAIPLPEDEGVYDVAIAASATPVGRRRSGSR